MNSKNIIVSASTPEAYSQLVIGTIWVNPTLNEIRYINESGVGVLYSVGAAFPLEFEKSLSIISPVNTDRVGIYYMVEANKYYFLNANYFVRGTSASVSAVINSSTTRTGTATALATLTSGTSTAGASFGTASALLGNVYIWVEITAVSGTVDEFWLQLNFGQTLP
jgi:hypothetical protein